jgi:outer membrane protein OmpA-like peptidoglycan-associated protein
MKGKFQFLLMALSLCLAAPAWAETPAPKEKPKAAATSTAKAKPAKPESAAKPAAAAATPAPAPKPSADADRLGRFTPKADLFLGYQFVRANPANPLNNFNVHGGGADIAFNVNNRLGIVADVGGGRFSREISPGVDVSGSVFNFLFGPRFSWRNHQRAVPFLQALFGGVHGSAEATALGTNGENSFGMALGGGLDIVATPRIAIRPFQLEYLMTRFTGPSLDRETQNNMRFKSGIVFRLGNPPPPPPPPNRGPSATCAASPSSIITGSGASVGVSASANDPDGDPLSYSWSASAGTVEGSGANVRWNAGSAAPGMYRVTANVSDGKGGTTSCTSEIRVEVKPNAPPSLSCSMERSSVLSGERARINASASDPDNDRLNITWRTSGGQVVGSGTNVQLDTTGLSAGRYTVTGRAEDGRGAADDCSATVEVTVPPPPPQAAKINECLFRASSARVDNVCKRILDDVATRLNSDASASVVLIGYHDPAESAKLNARRSDAAARYLGEKGVAAHRISQRPATGQKGAGAQNRRVDVIWVPAGATY